MTQPEQNADSDIPAIMILTVDPAAGQDLPVLADRVALLAAHVNAVRVNTLGIGFALSDLIAARGVEHERFNPVASWGPRGSTGTTPVVCPNAADDDLHFPDGRHRVVAPYESEDWERRYAEHHGLPYRPPHDWRVPRRRHRRPFQGSGLTDDA